MTSTRRDKRRFVSSRRVQSRPRRIAPPLQRRGAYLAAEEVERVVEVDDADGEHVGDDGHRVVGHALRDPDRRGPGRVGEHVKDEALGAVVAQQRAWRVLSL